MASIHDVAELADVSIATVSHVINGTRYVSPELTGRVERALAELDYRPHAVARSLRRRQTQTIGLLLPSLEIPFFALVAYSIERAARDNGYGILLCNSNWEEEDERRLLRYLLARRVDGMICISATMGATQIEPVIDSGIPVVMFERQMAGVELDAVGIDNYKGAYMATQHLLELGHRRIGVIQGKAISTISSARLHGYQEALAAAGLTPDPSLLYRGDYLPQSGREAAVYFLSLVERPSAIFAFNDMMALGALQYLAEQRLRVPEEMALVGFDGIPISRYTSPSLTTLRQPLGRMGRKAIDLLLQRIHGEAPRATQYLKFEPELIVRGSTVPAPEESAVKSETFSHA